jgi:hypothetical protein
MALASLAFLYNIDRLPFTVKAFAQASHRHNVLLLVLVFGAYFWDNLMYYYFSHGTFLTYGEKSVNC